MIKLISFFIFLFSLSVYGQKYESYQLVPMPIEFQKAIQNYAYETGSRSFAKSRLLGLNHILFSGSNLVKYVGIKYDVQGEFQSTVVTESGIFEHIQDHEKKTWALFFHGYESREREKIKNDLSAIATKGKKTAWRNFLNFSFISSAQASGCDTTAQFANTYNSTITPITQKLVIDGLMGCLSGIGEGAWDSTGGMVTSVMEGAWSCLEYLGNEACEFVTNPSQKLTQYGNAISKGVTMYTNFVTTIAQMLVDPNFALTKLNAFGSGVGAFIGKMYQSMKGLPTAVMIKALCSFVTGIGVDALIAVFTGGAASPKLALTLVRFEKTIAKLTKAFRLISKLGLEKLKIAESKLKILTSKIFDGSLEMAKLDRFEALSKHGDFFTKYGLKGLTCEL